MVIFHEPGVVAQMWLLDASVEVLWGSFNPLMTPFGVASDVWCLQSTVFRLPRGCPLSLTIRSVRLGLNVLSW